MRDPDRNSEVLALLERQLHLATVLIDNIRHKANHFAAVNDVVDLGATQDPDDLGHIGARLEAGTRVGQMLTLRRTEVVVRVDEGVELLQLQHGAVVEDQLLHSCLTNPLRQGARLEGNSTGTTNRVVVLPFRWNLDGQCNHILELGNGTKVL